MITAVVGLGLIGGSVARRLRGFHDTKIIGIDTSGETLRMAKSDGVIDRAETSGEYVSDADLIILCLYPEANVNFVKKYAPIMKKGAVITDVSGVKQYVVDNIQKYLPDGLDTIIGALLLAPAARLIAFAADPVVNAAMEYIGMTITAATEQSPVIMGFLLGGIMKMICTSPLSSMALTAMLGLTGLPMGIAAIACVAGSFTNGILFARLHLGDRSNVIAVMLEPLTQAHIITRYPIPIYASDFLGGGLAGIAAALLGIVNNAPGTASPIPGLLAPFAFNPAGKVVLALAIGAASGIFAGLVGSFVFKRFATGEKASVKAPVQVSGTALPSKV